MGGTYNSTSQYHFQNVTQPFGDSAKIHRMRRISRNISCHRKNCCTVPNSFLASDCKMFLQLNCTIMLHCSLLRGRTLASPCRKTQTQLSAMVYQVISVCYPHTMVSEISTMLLDAPYSPRSQNMHLISRKLSNGTLHYTVGYARSNFSRSTNSKDYFRQESCSAAASSSWLEIVNWQSRSQKHLKSFFRMRPANKARGSSRGDKGLCVATQDQSASILRHRTAKAV